MKKGLLWLLGFACLPSAGAPPASEQWVALTNPHFEIYSQTSGETPRKALAWFERLRAVLAQGGFLPPAPQHPTNLPILRVIGFRSPQEYEPFRLRSAADAYYTSNTYHEYIVMPSLEPRRFSIAAHEYSHFALHAAGWKLPDWLAEGLAEYFSTIEFTSHGYQLGGDLPSSTQILQRSNGMPLSELFTFKMEANARQPREYLERFYAQSWSLADMLMSSPVYNRGLHNLMVALNSSVPGAQAFENVYGKSLNVVSQDLIRWNGHKHARVAVAMEPADLPGATLLTLSQTQSAALLADVLVAGGNLDRARAQYTDLARQTPADPDIHVALGNLAMKQGNRDLALREWRLALDNGAKDPDLCFRYALTAEDAGAPRSEITASLVRAIALRPDFDDARFKLALMESNAGNYAATVEQLQAMLVPNGPRAYGYWSALAYAFSELGKREEAVAAAHNAFEAATSDEDRDSARRIAYVASTDLKTQFVRDPDGNLRMTTTRVEHGVADWNPFVEPHDQMRRSVGQLTDVLCKADKLIGFRVNTPDDALVLSVRDPLHVLIENGPPEFYCGPSLSKKAVQIDYAVVESTGIKENILRGMKFTGSSPK